MILWRNYDGCYDSCTCKTKRRIQRRGLRGQNRTNYSNHHHRIWTPQWHPQPNNHWINPRAGENWDKVVQSGR
ncbi:unnamed protein product [Prunus armeniaca]|uniref:Uncharacterized protein n=1 Tax=Prunus armeniaca TaxID=36596 RepID=A0A6J5X773_PRUAR|nr:unnamed protein product [Prunus armeniaca]